MTRRARIALVGALGLAIGVGSLLLGSETQTSRAAPSKASAPVAAAGRPMVRDGLPTSGALPAPRKSTHRKTMTQARAALQDSRPPVVAGLSIDLQGTPRERLLDARTRRIGESRAAQLDRLQGRSRARIALLREQLETATGARREELERQLQIMEHTDAWRSRVVSPTVRRDTRPGSERR